MAVEGAPSRHVVANLDFLFKETMESLNYQLRAFLEDTRTPSTRLAQPRPGWISPSVTAHTFLFGNYQFPSTTCVSFGYNELIIPLESLQIPAFPFCFHPILPEIHRRVSPTDSFLFIHNPMCSVWIIVLSRGRGRWGGGGRGAGAEIRDPEELHYLSDLQLPCEFTVTRLPDGSARPGHLRCSPGARGGGAFLRNW